MLHAEDVTGNTDTPAQESKVYYLNVSEAGGDEDSWTLPGNWSTVRANTKSNAEAAGGVHPENFNLPNDGFIVPADSGGYTLRTAANGSNGNSEWNGKYLQLGGAYSAKSYIAVLRLVVRNNGKTTTFNNDGLIMAGRSVLQAYYSKSTYNLYGIISVTAEDEKYPAIISERRASPSANLNINGKFRSSSAAFARVDAQTNNFTVTFADTTEFFGKLTATNEYEDADATVILQSDFPGTISISTNTVLAPANGIKIANLSVFDGAVIDASAGTFEVTTSLSCSGKIRVINVPAFGEDVAVPRFADVIRIPANCGLTMDNFEFIMANGTPLDCDSYSTFTENGITTIKAFRAGVVTLTTTDSNSWKYPDQSAMTNSAQWSDGKLPNDNLIDYVVRRIDNRNTALRTFDTTSAENPNNILEFQGHSLTIDNSYFVIVNKKFIANPLVLRNSAIVYYFGDLDASEIGGTLVAEQGRAILRGMNYQTNTLSARVKGTGCLEISSLNGASTGNCSSRHRIVGANDDFKGMVCVTIPPWTTDNPSSAYKITPLFDRNFTTLFLTEDRNLGGVLPALNRKAFTIENMSRVQPDLAIASLTLDEPTRGIFINWVGRLFANEGQTLTVRSPLAVHGTLWKEGEGMLVLANPAPTFGEDAESATPDADATNRTFRVAGGDVKIASADAVNGLDVVFTNGAGRIVLDLDSEDETFRTFGLRNTKAATPFAVEGDVSEIPVVLNFANPPEIGSSRGLVTVTSEDRNPAAKVSLLSFEKSPALYGIIVSREWVNNGNGTFTLKATFKDVGMRIVIR